MPEEHKPQDGYSFMLASSVRDLLHIFDSFRLFFQKSLVAYPDTIFRDFCKTIQKFPVK